MQELREGMKSGIGVQCNRSKSEKPTLGWKGHQLSWQTDCSISLDSWQTIKLASFSFLTTVLERSCLCSLPPDSQFFHAESLSAFFLLTPPWTTLGLPTFLCRPAFLDQKWFSSLTSEHKTFKCHVQMWTQAVQDWVPILLPYFPLYFCHQSESWANSFRFMKLFPLQR